MEKFLTFIDLVNARESVRSYDPRPVPRELINRCIEAARLAPSACNAQPWKFIVVDDLALRDSLAEAARNKVLSVNLFAAQAPVHVVVVREKANLTSGMGQLMKDHEYPLIDIGIAVSHFCLQAVEMGLGTCIMGWFDEKKVKRMLGIPGNKRAELLITVGYPASSGSRIKRRKTLDLMSSYNRY